MEEDIKILQDKDLLWKYPEKRILQAIENLINRNKELEEENRLLKRASNIAENIKVEDITEAMNKAYKDFINEFIPKSKVIEQLDKLDLDEEEQESWDELSGSEAITLFCKQLLKGG